MKPLSSLLPARPQKHGTPSSQWSDLVGRFTESYNKTTQPKYQYTEKRMATRLSPILKAEGIGYLEYLYEDLKKTPCFGKAFNWRLNPKNVR